MTLKDPMMRFATERTADVNALNRASLPVCLCLGLMLLTTPLWAVSVDDFSADQGPLTLTDPGDAAGDTAFSDTTDGSILGSERTLLLSLISVAATESTSVEVTGGDLVFSADAGTRGQVEVGYDAQTGDPSGPLDVVVGLGGVDLTASNHSGMRLLVSSTSAAGVEVELDIHSSATNASRFGLRLPAVAASQSFICSFSDFADLGSGGGADFSSVTAIVLRVRGTGVSANISALETIGPALLQANVLNVDTLNDGDADNLADPGETIRFSITLTNTGAEAQSISLGDVLDQNVTGQAMSLFTTPIAQRDTYQTCGNASLDIDAASGVLANDSDPDGAEGVDPVLTVTATDTTLTQGTVSVNPDGSFSYDPPAAFQGVDTFGYTVTDDDGRTSTAEVAVILKDLVWFLDDDDDTGPFTGTRTNPFNSLSAAEAASGPGDILYVVSDDGVVDRLDETITLQDDQQLIGGGVPFTLCGLNIPAGTPPGLSDTGFILRPSSLVAVKSRRGRSQSDKGIFTPPVVTAANRNQIRGLRLDANDTAALEADGINHLTVSDIGIVRTGAEGIFLSDVSGTILFTALTVQDAGVFTTVVNIDGSNADIDFVNSTLTPSGGSLVYIDSDGSTVDFVGGTMTLTNGSNVPGIELENNSGTYNFGSLGSMTTSDEGISADNGGTFTVPAATTVTSTGRAALDITNNTAFGVDPLIFASLSASGTSLGVEVSDVAQGLTVTGPVSVTTTNRGLVASNTGTITMNNAANSVVSTGGPALDLMTLNAAMTFARVSSSNSGSVGVTFQSVTGAVTINDAAPGSSITGAAGTAFLVGSLATNQSGGTANISFAGDIANTAGRSLEVLERNGGTVTVSGAINDSGTGLLFERNDNGAANNIVVSGTSKVFNTGANNAIMLDNNDNAIITFSNGGLDVDTTTGAAFTAINGAAGINVMGSNNTLTSTAGGRAVEILASSIGTNGMTCESIDATGGTTAINMVNTGGGVFEVTGDGPSDPANTTRGRTTALAGGGAITLGSGGTISNTTGDSITLLNADNVILRNMVLSNNGGGSRDGIFQDTGTDNLTLDNLRITGFSDNGLFGRSSSGLTMQHCEVETNAKSANSVANDEANIRFDNLFGTASISNSLIRDVNQDNIRVSSCEAASCGGPSLDLTLNNVSVRDTLPGAGGNVGLLVRSFNDANVDLTVTGSEFLGNRSVSVQHNTNNSSQGSTVVMNSTMDRNANAISVAHQGAGMPHTFNISGNTINQAGGVPANQGNAINVFLGGLSTVTTTLSGFINENQVGNAATADSGSIAGQGINLFASGAGTLTASVANNTVRGIRFDSAFQAISSTHSGNLNVTLRGNRFDVTPVGAGGFPLAGLDLVSGAVATDSGTLCADILGSGGAPPGGTENIAFVGDAFFSGAYITTSAGNPTVELVGYAGADNNQGQIEAFLDSSAGSVTPAATGSFTTFLGAGTVTGRVAPCPQP